MSAHDLGALTPRERDVLELLAGGYSNEGIADALSLSKRTVDVHVSAIFGKLHLPQSSAHNRRVRAAAAWFRAARRL